MRRRNQTAVGLDHELRVARSPRRVRYTEAETRDASSATGTSRLPRTRATPRSCARRSRRPDGADEFEARAGQTLTLSAENPFNFIALWATDFSWSPDALKLALDCLVPVAQSSMHLHTRSHRKMMRPITQEMTCEIPKRQAPPATL